MECTVSTNKGKKIIIPLEDGYRDEKAIRDAEENNHRIFHWAAGYWEAAIDIDAERVLRVTCRIGQYNGI